MITICLLSFAAGSFLALDESGAIADAEREMTSTEARLKNLRFSDPAPSVENVEASSENVALLKSARDKIREDLQRGDRLTTSRDGIAVMAGVQQFISTYQRKSSELVEDTNNKPAPISLPQNFAFGFQEYIDEAKPLSDPKRSAVLDQQRQILSYLMDKLIEAKPTSIVSVQREFLEQGQGRQSESFQINEAVSARVPGAIDTLAFQLSFTGYTDSLRSFLNDLAKFDLPIVVRSIDVQRPNKSKSSTAVAANNDLDSIFGAFGGSIDDEAPKEAQKPVISENISTFTIVLEFIEIILSTDSAQDKA